MAFLIGVIILIVFVVFVYLFIKFKIRNILDSAGFRGMNLKEVIDEARLQDQENPKSLSSMDSIYLEQIKKDFKDININELKRNAEKAILDLFNSVEKKDTSNLKGKIKSISLDMINDYSGKDVKFNDIRFHKTVVSNYKKDKGVATIDFGCSFQYYLDVDGNNKKVQDRARVEFIYVFDLSKVDKYVDVIGIHCPNCGSPITNLGEKKCSYCGGAVYEIIGRVFTCNDIVRY